jgi:SAM-dependent methyltransferase
VNKGFNFITPEMRAGFNIEDNEKPSDHPYNPTAMQLIAECEHVGGMALDCGSGSREFTNSHLVQCEIMAYDNVDILAVAQNLPFADHSFDIVFSFDVLEHVTDPFQSARELARVLKPGGRLYIDMPFLQVEHGYPHHYFNATRMGLRQLFEGHLRAEAHIVPQSGHPAHLLWIALNTYRKGLAGKERAAFENRSVGEILNGDWKALRDSGTVSDAMKWKMASATQAIFIKDGAESRVSVDVGRLPNFAKSKSLV